MRVLPAVAQGLARALGAPRLVLWLWAANLAVALPAAVVVGAAIEESIGSSLAADELRTGLDLGWLGEFQSGARGLAATLTPSVVGPAALFDNLEARWSGRLFSAGPEVLAFGGVYALLWLLLLGGVVERLANPGGGGSAGELLAAGCRWFFRFLRLAVLSAGLYYGLFRLSRKLFPWIDSRLEEVTVETTALAYHLLGAALVVGALVAIQAVFDLARVAMVIERRRSAFLAAVAGALFLVRHPLRVGGVYLAYGVFSAALVAAWAMVAPGPGLSSWWAVVSGFAAAQLMLVAKLALRVALLGSEVALYRPLARR